MSRQPQMLQGEVSFKRQVLSIVLITGIVFGAWWSLTGIVDLVTGGSRSGYDAEQDLSDSPGGTYGLFKIGMPPFPDIDYQSLLDNLSPELLDQLQEMMAGNMDFLDPSMLSDLLGEDPEALNTVMFRVYNDYGSLGDVGSELFRYSVFDAFSNSEWTKTYAVAVPGLYENNMVYPDVTPEYRIRIPLGTISAGEEYSVVVPGVSPETYIRGGSFQPQNSDNFDWNSIQTPYVDDYGIMSEKPIFGVDGAQNISVRSWGFERSGGSYFYNTTTRSNPTIIASGIRSRYLGFPGGVSANQYAASRPAFTAATVAIQNRFNTNPSANLFVKANMIRNYIQESFSCDPFTASNAVDIVEDTCQNRVGDFYAIASIYVMLARYFQIPARFVTGYSGFSASETTDPYGSENYQWAQNTVEMKLLNMYVWAETFMPVQDDGTGDWVPIDTIQASFGDGYSNGNPEGSPVPANTELRLFVNGTVLDTEAFLPYFYSVDRPAIVNITVNVTVEGTPYNGPVMLYDLLEDQTLTVITAIGGRGEFLWDVNTSVIAGGHGIRATAGTLMNFTGLGVRGALNLEFVNRVPSTIDRTTLNLDLRVSGYLEDINYVGSRSNNYIPKAGISVQLITDPGNNLVDDPFIPGAVTTNDTGEFETNVTLASSVVPGSYDVRLLFPGLFIFNIPQVGSVYAGVSGMFAQSLTWPLDVVDPDMVGFAIYLNGTPNSVFDRIYNEGQTINATVQIQVGGIPFVGTSVYFEILDNQLNESPYPIGSATTDSNGWANRTWVIPSSYFTGPAVVRARVDRGGGDLRFAYAFCFINRSTTLYLSTITPSTIDINNPPYMIFTANLNDSNTRPVLRAGIRAYIYDKGSNPSGFTIPPDTTLTGSDGKANWNSRVAGSDELGYYDLRCEFYSDYAYYAHPWADDSGLSPGYRYVAQATTNNSIKRELLFTDSSNINMCNLWVNGTPAATGYNDGNIGVIFNTGNIINFTARCQKGGVYQTGEPVDFYDMTQGTQIGTTVYTNSLGFATLQYSVPSNWITGPHEITMTYHPSTGSRNNYTVVFITDTIHLDGSNIYIDRTNIVRDVTTVRVFGALKDTYPNGVYKARVNLQLFDSSYVQQYGYINGPTSVVTDIQGNFSFNIMLTESLPQGAYYFRVVYNQVIDANSFSHCPTYLTGRLNAVQSPYLGITVNATISISGSYYTPLNPLQYSEITVYGTFQWDNNTAFQSYLASWITVKVTQAGDPSILLYSATISPAEIDAYGNVGTSIVVTWSVNFVVTWVFTPPDAYVTRASVEAPGT